VLSGAGLYQKRLNVDPTGTLSPGDVGNMPGAGAGWGSRRTALDCGRATCRSVWRLLTL